MTDNLTGENNDPIYDGEALTEVITETYQADGYKPTPYYAVNIGTVLDGSGNPNPGWSILPRDPFSPEPFYAYRAELNYTGTLACPNSYDVCTYFFAAADINDDGKLTFNSSNTNGNSSNNGRNTNNSSTDGFSPKTTSAVTRVPEPSTIILLGAGLLGLGILGMKCKKVGK